MSAEPSHTGPDGGIAATVLLFRNPSQRRTPRREETVPTQPGQSPHQRLADLIESLFLKHDNRTLSDPETEQVYLITLQAVLKMHDGALAQGVVGEDAHRELAAMVHGMMAAPRLV